MRHRHRKSQRLAHSTFFGCWNLELVMALVAVGRVAKQVVGIRPKRLMKQHIIAFFMANHATFTGRRIGMTTDAMGWILATRRPPAAM
jgi:hypothetical protein